MTIYLLLVSVNNVKLCKMVMSLNTVMDSVISLFFLYLLIIVVERNEIVVLNMDLSANYRRYPQWDPGWL